MPEEQPHDRDQLASQVLGLAHQLHATNLLLRKIQSRSIFWPVCFAIILAPIVAGAIVIGLLMIPVIGGAITSVRAENRQLQAEMDAMDAARLQQDAGGDSRDEQRGGDPADHGEMVNCAG